MATNLAEKQAGMRNRHPKPPVKLGRPAINNANTDAIIDLDKNLFLAHRLLRHRRPIEYISRVTGFSPEFLKKWDERGRPMLV